MAIFRKSDKFYVFNEKTKELEWLIELSEVKHFDKVWSHAIYEIDNKFFSRTFVRTSEMPKIELDETYEKILCVAITRGSDFEILDEKKDEVVEMTIFDFL